MRLSLGLYRKNTIRSPEKIALNYSCLTGVDQLKQGAVLEDVVGEIKASNKIQRNSFITVTNGPNKTNWPY